MFTVQSKVKTLSVLAALSILPVTSAQAEIIAVSGNASFEGAALNTDLTAGAYEQDGVVFGFNERQCLEIDAGEFLVDYLIDDFIENDEEYIGIPLSGGVTPDPNLTLPSSEGYASHIIHFDPAITKITRSQSPSAVDATFEFDNDIIAIIVNSGSLIAGDGEFGYASTTYSTGAKRGFEANDLFTIDSPTSLTVNGVISPLGRIDNMRVITANPDCD